MKKLLFIVLIILLHSNIYAQVPVPVKSIKQLEIDCDNNDFLACFYAGQLFQDTGLNLSAVTAYKKACDNKIYESCVNLGKLFKNDYNENVQKEAVKLFNTACDNNISAGCFEMASLYFKGDIVRKSQSKARKLYEKAIVKITKI